MPLDSHVIKTVHDEKSLFCERTQSNEKRLKLFSTNISYMYKRFIGSVHVENFEKFRIFLFINFEVLNNSESIDLLYVDTKSIV